MRRGSSLADGNGRFRYGIQIASERERTEGFSIKAGILCRISSVVL